MDGLEWIGAQIGVKRRAIGWTQSELGKKAGVSRSTLDALENGRARELGFTKLNRILTVLGLELRLEEASSRPPTLEELMAEDRDDQSLGRPR